MVNNIFFSQAWDNSRNIGNYYNEFMQLLPEGSYGCLMDYDAMFLTNDYGKHLYEYVNRFPDSVLTCRTNRLHASNNWQRLDWVEQDNHNINYHRVIATNRKAMLYNVTNISKPHPTKLMGGMLMVVPKSIWNEIKFDDTGILNVDNNFHKKLIQRNKKVLVMEGIYVYHWYRNDGSKSHLI